jgi:hypothetical protein
LREISYFRFAFLAPFAVNSLYFNMMKRLPNIESLDQVAGVTAAGLSQAAAASAYELFCDKEFRRMAGLERLGRK